jgi:hypothetical protein
LEQSEEYKHLKLLERVGLFDTVNVEFPALKVSATAKVVKVVYDVISDRVKSATLGSVRANIADTIATQQKEIEKKPSKTFMQTAIESLTKTILGAKGGSVRLLDTDSDGEPDTLYIADNPDPMQAKKVWRFNYAGWGASNDGYDGPFEMGATLENGFLANFITAGTMSSVDGKMKILLDEGRLVAYNDYGGDVDISAGHVICSRDKVQGASLWAENGKAGRVTLGNCFIQGDENRLWIYTRESETLQLTPLFAEWQTIRYNDESGNTQTITALVGKKT